MTDAPPSHAAADLPTRYAPAEVEATLYQRWVDAGYFEVDAASEKPAYCIVIPPPNVTGSLHLGHAFEHTLIDALVRRRRMQGYEALWLPGMDHAGIATQNVVERELAKQGLSRHDLGREAFVEKVWEWKAESGGKILGQMKRLGDGVAWQRERFTMDEGLSRAVHTMFKMLYDDELIYRAERIINWCPRCRTALSDIEVEHSEDAGELVSIRYGDGADTSGVGSIVVATTRAETMLGDTAVAVHPEDARYSHLIGTTVELPLTGRQIPIVADEHVDPAFGTGAVKVTPAHDPNDFAIGQRHNLPSITIMDEAAVVTAHGPFQGMDRFEARPAVVAALRADGRIVAEKRPYLHSVGHCSRCKTVVEPRLSLQWFVNVAPLAKAAGDAVRDGRVTIHPKEMEPRWFGWVDHMHDWCISRQLWWGHRIPVWYGPDGEVRCIGPDDEPPGEGWTQDEDVLDTWFSSGLWPFSTLGWPERTPELAKFYPNSVLYTGYDILFFWVARMMMFGLYAMKDDAPSGDIPFHTIGLHGMVRDQFGKKMSKSFGNAVDPLDWMDAYGSDALRFTLARGANPGTDAPIGEDWVAGSRNFCNKLWNATRFALLNGATVDTEVPPREQLAPADRWMLSRLHASVAEIDAFYEDYEFAKATEALYHLVWDEFCDWYLELAKAPLARGGAEAEATRAVLGHTLDVLLKLLHPVIPFVTEQLWTTLTGGESVVIAAWPEAQAAYADADAEAQIAAVQDLITEIRRFRSDQGVPPAKKVAARITTDGSVPGLAEHEDQVRALTRLTAAEDTFAAGATLQVKGATIELDLSGAIDVAAERARLEKDLTAARKEIEAADAKLANADFLAKAPEQVVAKIHARKASGEADVARISGQLDALPAS